MYFLNEATLDEVIKELANLVRAGIKLDDTAVDELAESQCIRPDELRDRFLRRYPDGKVPRALPTLEEASLQKSRSKASAAIEEYHPFSEIDGRECFLDGRRHTLITRNNSRKTVIAFSHEELRVVHIPFTVWLKMQKRPV